MPWLPFIKNRAKADAAALGEVRRGEKSGFARFESTGMGEGFNSCVDHRDSCLILRQHLLKN
jgi:hypothetical protein